MGHQKFNLDSAAQGNIVMKHSSKDCANLLSSTSESRFNLYASVIPEVSIDKTLDYGIPIELENKLSIGSKVSIPIRGRIKIGYIFSIKDKPDFTPVMPIHNILVEEIITPELFELALWMTKYYCSNLRQVFKAILPAAVRKETKHKQQLFVMRNKTRDELKEYCELNRNKYPSQALVIDTMLQVTKGMLLTELLEETVTSRSVIDGMVKKGLLSVDIVRIDRSPLVNEEYFLTKPKKLNQEQEQALSRIVSTLEKQIFETHLLFGITGSGKTEVYLQAIEKALSDNKGVIMLVPEISLTSQMIERFRSRFEGRIAVLHHRLSQGERFDEWHRIHRGEAEIVIGARSAIFSPVKNLGLIIVDEEHESSYKQGEESPCYHARDIAVMRGKISKSAVVLGSATPSLESFYNAKKGKYHLSCLSKRAELASLPDVRIVDMRLERERNKDNPTQFSEALLAGIKKRVAVGEQAILFLNRRGYHTTLICRQCNESVKCKHCDLSLTFHKGANHLSCHLCGYFITPPPKSCPLCKFDETMKFRGIGTEQIERALHAILPDIRTIRIDADTTKHKGSHQALLREFGTGKADVLIGTQMIAKGLHFPQVTLVGVINSDGTLQIPDFRSSENVFQLITQVAGRSGRGASKGEVIIQTSLPENETIQVAAKQDYLSFYESEIAVREAFNYPPFTHFAKILFTGENIVQVQRFAEHIKVELEKCLPSSFSLMPVIPAGYAKIKDSYRFQFLVKGSNMYLLNKTIERVLQENPVPKELRLFIDIDPSSTFF